MRKVLLVAALVSFTAACGVDTEVAPETTSLRSSGEDDTVDIDATLLTGSNLLAADPVNAWTATLWVTRAGSTLEVPYTASFGATTSTFQNVPRTVSCVRLQLNTLNFEKNTIPSITASSFPTSGTERTVYSANGRSVYVTASGNALGCSSTRTLATSEALSFNVIDYDARCVGAALTPGATCGLTTTGVSMVATGSLSTTVTGQGAPKIPSFSAVLGADATAAAATVVITGTCEADCAVYSCTGSDIASAVIVGRTITITTNPKAYVSGAGITFNVSACSLNTTGTSSRTALSGTVTVPVTQN